MSDTPRTDKQGFGCDAYIGDEPEYRFAVRAEFARQLERELAAANRRVAELERIIEDAPHEPMCGAIYTQDDDRQSESKRANVTASNPPPSAKEVGDE